MLRKLVTIFVSLLVLILGVVGYAIWSTGDESFEEVDQYLVDIPQTNMTLTSPVFVHGGFIPTQYTCDGANVNPPLVLSQVPVGTQSLVLMVEDPDAPSGMWLHWLVYGLDASLTQIEEQQLAAGAKQAQNDFGQTTYGGPCPPVGEHRYFFTIYAVDIPISFPDGVRANIIRDKMAGHIIGKAELVGRYSR